MELQEPPNSDSSDPKNPNPNNNNNNRKVKKKKKKERKKKNKKYKKLTMVSAVLNIPKDNPYTPIGDDANFICAAAETIGVADGVGGCWKSGVDPGRYSRRLMKHSAEAVSRAAEQGEAVDPMAVLSEAHAKTTACIVAHTGLRGGVLRAVNVGDSGFAVFRKNKVVFRSEAQQWRFNCPYMLSRGEGPKDIAAEIETAVEKNGVIVLATDGFWDNVFERDIERALESVGGNVDDVVDLERFVCDVTNIAFRNSHLSFIETPFSVTADLALKHCLGGKEDDITVIVAQIISS